MITDNVLLFPNIKKDEFLPQTLQEIEEDVVFNRMEFIDQNLINPLMATLYSELLNSGLKLDKTFFSRYIYCIEMLKAVLYDEIDGYHPFLDDVKNGVERMMQEEVFKDKIDRMDFDDDDDDY